MPGYQTRPGRQLGDERAEEDPFSYDPMHGMGRGGHPDGWNPPPRDAHKDGADQFPRTQGIEDGYDPSPPK